MSRRLRPYSTGTARSRRPPSTPGAVAGCFSLDRRKSVNVLGGSVGAGRGKREPNVDNFDTIGSAVSTPFFLPFL